MNAVNSSKNTHSTLVMCYKLQRWRIVAMWLRILAIDRSRA